MNYDDMAESVTAIMQEIQEGATKEQVLERLDGLRSSMWHASVGW